MTVLPLVVGIVAAVAGVLGLRRVLRWAGRRGWIYYGKDRPPVGAGGTALMEWASIFEPEVEFVLEEQRSGDLRLVHAETGEPIVIGGGEGEEGVSSDSGHDEQPLPEGRTRTEGR
jgi:hypothetical protein